MLAAAIQAFGQTFSPPFRRILLKSIGLAVLLFALLGAILHSLIARLAILPQPFDLALAIATGLGIFAGAIYLMPPITALIAAFFADQVAEEVERTSYPADPPGRALPLGTALIIAARFFGLAILVNFIALLLLLLPGINIGVFFFANAYLLSREYFELAAMRHRPVGEARALRRARALRVFLAGFILAGVVAVPVLNLITPVFATAFMVHLHKQFSPVRELLPPEGRG